MSDQKHTVKKTFGIVFNVFFYLVIIALVVFSIANMQVKREDDIANVFGVGFLSVQSDSMAGELPDSFNQGDMVLVSMLDDQSRNDLAVGDIVTFFDLSIKQFNTHRIVEIYTLDDETFVITRGDNTEGDDQPIHISQVLSVYRSSIDGLGQSLDYLQTPTGFAVFVILPVVLILVFEGVVLARNIMQLNHAKLEEKYATEKSQAAIDLEAEKERIRQEILKELKQKEEQDK